MTTKKKSTRTAAAEQARRNAWAAGADACAADTPPTQPQLAQPMRICNASMRGGDYRTGYGEVHQPLRAGAMRALQVPSRGIGA